MDVNGFLCRGKHLLHLAVMHNLVHFREKAAGKCLSGLLVGLLKVPQPVDTASDAAKILYIPVCMHQFPKMDRAFLHPALHLLL